jgi:hypothetical protein
LAVFSGDYMLDLEIEDIAECISVLFDFDKSYRNLSQPEFIKACQDWFADNRQIIITPQRVTKKIEPILKDFGAVSRVKVIGTVMMFGLRLKTQGTPITS